VLKDIPNGFKGIQLANSDRTIVRNNLIDGETSTGYGIGLINCDNCTIGGNSITGFSIPGNEIYLTDGTTPDTTLIANNSGYLGIGETRTFRKTVNYDNTSPVAVCSVRDGFAVTDVWVEIVTAFDDTGLQTLDIGDGDNNSGFMANANIDSGVSGYYGINEDERGVYLWNDADGHRITKLYTDSGTINCFIGTGNSDGTRGQAIVYLKITRIGG